MLQSASVATTASWEATETHRFAQDSLRASQLLAKRERGCETTAASLTTRPIDQSSARSSILILDSSRPQRDIRLNIHNYVWTVI
jgi:hypothetical protein